MKKSILLAAICCISTTPYAVENTLTYSGEGALTSNYIWRGVSQSDEDPAVQAGAEVGYGGFNLGVWGSSVDFQDGDEAKIELDIYGGFSYDLTDNLSVSVGGIYYAYPGASGDLDYDFWEANAGVGYVFPYDIEAGASFSYSPEFFGDTGKAYYYEGNLTIPLWNGVYATGNFGWSDLDEGEGGEDYRDYGVGLGWSNDNFDLNLKFTDTDLDDAHLADEQWSVTAKILF